MIEFLCFYIYLPLFLLLKDLNSPDVYETSELPEEDQNIRTDQVRICLFLTITLLVYKKYLPTLFREISSWTHCD